MLKRMISELAKILKVSCNYNSKVLLADSYKIDLQFMQTKRGTKLLTSGWWGTLRHPNYLGKCDMS